LKVATNSYFQNYNNQNEQSLIDDLIVEAIQIFGVNTYYIKRSLNNVDEIMNEDRISTFTEAYGMEMYIKSVDGFQGEGDFLSKFGLQIRDQITFTVAVTTFKKYTLPFAKDIVRPNEGDLVYFPMNDKFFVITFVEHESIFYQAGALQVYDLKCELFEYSNQKFETGVKEIDEFYDSYDTSNIETLEDLHDADFGAKNIYFENETDDILDFSETDPFSENIDYPRNS
jgi:hypothetical protein